MTGFNRTIKWSDLAAYKKKNIFISTRNSGVFDGLYDLFVKNRPDGTMMKIRQVRYDTKTDIITVYGDFRWGDEEIICKNWKIRGFEMFASTYDPFDIPVDEYIQGVLNR
ncbi:hypothetical protein ACRPK2_09695 [Lactococcus garvieae]|uniref:hypothetical protein n=1 Tax=Lactococcus garvieae TaxID=1363 RepID=UPI001153F331|nr:hypothetical protein [Lactococcus garvieae]